MNTPTKYRKKPVVIEAMQVLDDLRNHVEIRRWAESTTPEGEEIPVSITAFDSQIVIHTLEGDMRATIGDWIIRGVQGEFYPCKPDIFAATYEAAPAPRCSFCGEVRDDLSTGGDVAICTDCAGGGIVTRPSLAGIEKRVDRYLLTDPDTGEVWPINAPAADAVTLIAAVRDVLALHEPYTIWAYDDVNGVWIYDEHDEHVVVAIVCRECTPATSMSLLGDCEWTIDHPVVEHPCPTVRALAAHLDLTDPEGDPT